MSDDLIKRLRNGCVFVDSPAAGVSGMISEHETDILCDEAADRIEELEAKLSEQEALLAKAVWALKPYAVLARHHAVDSPEWGPFSSVSTCTSIMCLRNAAETLTELEGDPT